MGKTTPSRRRTRNPRGDKQMIHETDLDHEGLEEVRKHEECEEE